MKNKTARKELENLYGKGCFIERAGIRIITPSEEKTLKKTIKGFTTLDRNITYHHIQKKCEGGKATIENGANLARYNHDWLHEQDKGTQDEINHLLQEFKFKIDMAKIELSENGIILQKKDLKFAQSIIHTIPAIDNSQLTEKEYARLMYLRKKANKSKDIKNLKIILGEDDDYER